MALLNQSRAIHGKSVGRARQRAFTLVELAVVVAVIALMLGSLLIPLASQVEQRNVAQTTKQLDEIKEALLGFAMVNGRLPRPAVSVTDGTERALCGAGATGVVACTGYLPWVALGLNKTDAWSKMFRYSVSPEYADAAFNFSTSPANNKTIQTRDATGTLVNLTVVQSVPAVVLSYGPNNWGVTDNGSAIADVSTTNTDEDANNSKFNCAAAADCDNFISRLSGAYTGGAGGEFDDIVMWVPSTLLLGRMVAAGRLP